MTTYYIPTPEDQMERGLLDGMLNWLEHKYGVQTLTVIAVTTDDFNLRPLLSNLAQDVVEWRPAVEGSQEQKPAVDMSPDVHIESQNQLLDKKELAGLIATVVENMGAEANVVRACSICGKPVPKERGKSAYCSKTCYMKHYWKTHAKPSAREGDGIVNGSVLHR